MPERRKVTRRASSISSLLTPSFFAPASCAFTACWSLRAAAMAMARIFFVFRESWPSSQMCWSNARIAPCMSGWVFISSLKKTGTFPIFFSSSRIPFELPVFFDFPAGIFDVFLTAISSLPLHHGFTAADKFPAADCLDLDHVPADHALKDLPDHRDIHHGTPHRSFRTTDSPSQTSSPPPASLTTTVFPQTWQT